MDSRVPAASPQDVFVSRRGHSDASAASAEEERLPDPADARLRHTETEGVSLPAASRGESELSLSSRGENTLFLHQTSTYDPEPLRREKREEAGGGGFTPRGRATPKTGFERDATSSPVSSVARTGLTGVCSGRSHDPCWSPAHSENEDAFLWTFVCFMKCANDRKLFLVFKKTDLISETFCKYAPLITSEFVFFLFLLTVLK